MTSQGNPIDVTASEIPPRPNHRCPWWAGHFMASPLRKLLESPERMLGPHVSKGMTVLDVGCAMGFFSLPMAKMVGPQGRVICVDVEPRMIAGLKRRARRARHDERITALVCQEADLGLSRYEGLIDFAVAIHVVHELTDIRGSLAQIAAALKPGGRLLLLEPKGHVSEAIFRFELESAERAGLSVEHGSELRRRHGALLAKASAEKQARQ